MSGIEAHADFHAEGLRPFWKHATLALPLLAALLFAAVPPTTQAAPKLTREQARQLAFHVSPAFPFPTPNKWSVMQPGAQPLAVNEAAEPLPATLAWQVNGTPTTLNDYLERHPVTALLVAKDGQLVFEHFQLGGSRTALFLSNSMAKSLAGIAVAQWEASGKLPTLDVPTAQHVPALQGSLLGATTVRNQLRMASGIRYRETYQPGDDSHAFREAVEKRGLLEALKTLHEQEVPQGTRFNYAGPHTAALSLLAPAMGSRNLASAVEAQLWQKMGSEHLAAWLEDVDGATLAHCCLLARARDYLRLGIVLAHGGRRPDTGEQVVPPQLLARLADARQFDAPFRPPASGLSAYESQFWVSGTLRGAFSLVGIYGQLMVVYPQQGLVVLHLAVNTTASINGTPLLAERNALLTAIWRHCTKPPQRVGASVPTNEVNAAPPGRPRPP